MSHGKTSNVLEIFSRTQMSGMMTLGIPEHWKDHNQSLHIDSFNFTAFRAQADAELNREQKKKMPHNSTVVDKILSVILSKRYRRGPKKHFKIVEESYRAQLQWIVDHNQKIILVLPSFPVKCYNPIKCERKMPDLAELRCLTKMYQLCKEIESVYDHGAKVVLIADGLVYAPIFGEPDDVALEYRKQVEQFIVQLGIEDYIEMDDMAYLRDRHFDEYKRTREIAEKEITQIWLNEQNSELVKPLLENTMSNINLTMYTRDQLRSIFFNNQDGDIKKEIQSRATKSAFEYMVFLRTINSMDLVMKSFPGAIRVTCHPKPGQIGVHMLESCATFNFPWNGVGVLKKNGKVIAMLEDEVRRDERYRAVYVGDDKFPFYYEELCNTLIDQKNT
jgi:pyoverdine/dityrosine biosynthesis protein Dit1